MCLEFGSCFGGRTRDDYGRSRGNGYWSAPVTAPVYHQPQALAVDEAGHHDSTPKADHAAYLQDQAAASETPARHHAWHNKVGDDAGNAAPPRGCG